MSYHTDSLAITCHYCYKVIASKRGLEHHQDIAPSLAIRWYERMIKHIQKEHSRVSR